MAFGWRVVVREALAMARKQTANGGLDLRVQFVARHGDTLSFHVEALMPSEIKAISPLVDRLMRLIKGSRCIVGSEPAVELALREALNNAVIHGNRMDARKLVRVRCRCQLGNGVFIIVADQGQGFDPNAVPEPFAAEGLEAEHGRGIYLMKSAMDEVSFDRGGSEVHMRKGPVRNPRRELRSKPMPCLQMP
jgi:serine/threonine-protein kinase RsbW